MSNEYHVVRLGDRNTCILDPSAPGWIIVDRDKHGSLLSLIQKGHRLHTSDWSGLSGCEGNLDGPLLKQSASREEKNLHLYIETTRACNLRCIHCYNESGLDADEMLPASMIIDVLQEASDMGVTGITLSGGEPLIYDGLYAVLDCANELNIKTTIVTNGTIVDQAHAKALARRNPHITMSIDGSRPEVNDIIRGQGSFRAARSLW